MKKQIFYFSILLLSLLIYACKKEHIFDSKKTDNTATKFSVSDAKAYLDSALKTNSVSIKLSSIDTSSGTETFNGYLFWDKAQSFLNKNFEVVEVPTALDYRKVNFYKLGGDTSKYITDKAVAEAAFTRVLIFRDSTQKVIDKRIITYVPDKSYLSKNSNIASSNWISSIDKDYSGYIEYRTWDNIPYLVIRLTGGKVNAKYNLTRHNNAASIKTQGLKTNGQECDLISVPIIRTGWMNGEIVFQGQIGTENFLSCYETPDAPDGYSPEPTFGGGGGTGNNGNGTIVAQIVTVDPSIIANPKLNCINGKLLDNSVYNNLISKFINSSTYNLLIQAAPLNSIDLGLTNYSLQNVNVTITINSNQVDGNFAIDLAATFIHEAFHAYIDQDLIQRHIVGSEVYNQTYANTFDKYITAEVDRIIAANPTFSPEQVSHEILATNIDMIATGIKQYAEEAWPALKSNPSITFDNYRAIAWGSTGLTASTSYATEFDTAAKRDILNQNRNSIYGSTTRGCN